MEKAARARKLSHVVYTRKATGMRALLSRSTAQRYMTTYWNQSFSDTSAELSPALSAIEKAVFSWLIRVHCSWTKLPICLSKVKPISFAYWRTGFFGQLGVKRSNEPI